MTCPSTNGGITPYIGAGGAGSFSSTPTSITLAPVTQAICTVYQLLNTVLYLLALAVMLIGGTIYAIANVFPSSSRGQLQGYAMGMIMGGIAAAIIGVVAPYVLSVITGQSVTSILAVCSP